MTANAGYHLFNTGDVLTAAQVQYNLQNQTIMYFATAAARNSALSGVLVEGMFCYLADTNSTEYYDGAAWVSIASSGDLTAITAGNGISVTSGTGPVPTVAIDTSITVDKTTAQTLTNKTLTSAALTTPTISTLTTNGDLVYGTGSGALSRLGIGSAAQVLTVASGIPSWATPASGGGMTLLSTTTLSGATTTITIASNSYTNLQIIATGVTTAAGSPALRIAPNNSSTISDYAMVRNIAGTGASAVGDTAAYISSYSAFQNNNTANAFSLIIFNYSDTSYVKAFSWNGYYTSPGPVLFSFASGGGINTTSAISSLVFSPSTSTFNAGQVLVYGVK